MLYAWQRSAYTLHVISIYVRQDKSWSLRQARHHFAPRTDDHGITVGRPPVGVPAPLRWGDNEREVFDGPGP